MQKLVMVVDDSATIRRVVDFVFRMTEFSLVTAVNAGQALARANELTPDLVIIDAEMPEQDGYDLARKLRAGSRTSGWTLLMMVSDKGPDQERLGDTEIDGYVVKPFTCSELLDPVRMLTGVEVRHDVPLSFEQIMATRKFTQQQRDPRNPPAPDKPAESSGDAAILGAFKESAAAPAPAAPRATMPRPAEAPRAATPGLKPAPGKPAYADHKNPFAAPEKPTLPRGDDASSPREAPGRLGRPRTPAPSEPTLDRPAVRAAVDKPAPQKPSALPRSRTPMPDAFAPSRTPGSTRNGAHSGEAVLAGFGALGASPPSPAAPAPSPAAPAPSPTAPGKAHLTLEMIEALDADGASLPNEAPQFGGAAGQAQSPMGFFAPPTKPEASAPSPWPEPAESAALPPFPPLSGRPEMQAQTEEEAEPSIAFEDPVTLGGTRTSSPFQQAERPMEARAPKREQAVQLDSPMPAPQAAERERAAPARTAKPAAAAHAAKPAASSPSMQFPDPGDAPSSAANGGEDEDLEITAHQELPPASSQELPPARDEELPPARDEELPTARDEELPPANDDDIAAFDSSHAKFAAPERGPVPEGAVVSGIQTGDIDWGSVKKSRTGLYVGIAVVVLAIVAALFLKR